MEDIYKLLRSLEARNIHINQAILFGSYAKGDYNEYSDIDIALVSDAFEGFRIADNDKFRDLIIEINSDISPLPYRTEDFTEDNLFVKEILKYGIRII
ncbi:MAG: nucleotidyltransferase domain-containing protein [FCB group bacterium]